MVVQIIICERGINLRGCPEGYWRNIAKLNVSMRNKQNNSGNMKHRRSTGIGNNNVQKKIE